MLLGPVDVVVGPRGGVHPVGELDETSGNRLQLADPGVEEVGVSLVRACRTEG